MFTQPQVFRSYIIGGPSICYDNQVLLQFEERYAKDNQDLPARIFMGIGGLESPADLAAFWHLISVIKSREYENMVLETHVFPDETFASGIAQEIRGMESRHERYAAVLLPGAAHSRDRNVAPQ